MSKKRTKTSAPRPRTPEPSSQVAQETGLALLRAAAKTEPGMRPQPQPARAPEAEGTAARTATAARARTATSAASAPGASTGPASADAPASASTPLTASVQPVRPGVEVGRLEVSRFGCALFEGAERPALGVTYWFDTPADAPADPLTIAFSGRRVGVQGAPGTGDGFTMQTTVDEVVPGSGRTAVTARVRGITAGEWEVAAAPMLPDGRFGPAVTARGTTAFDPVVRVSGPGVRLGVWPLAVTLGTVLALVVQALLSAARDLPSLRVFLLTLLACVVGVAGAKVYYLATHRGQSTGLVTVGMSVQGFVLASIATLSLGALASGLPVGDVLDVTTPGLLYGVTVGRFGCFFGGCCTGRPTASRWGLWSSNRRVGVRRIPVQLMESAAAALVATVALLLLVAVQPPGGTVFVGAIAAYTFARQVLFPLRTVPRDTAHGRRIVMVVTALVVVADVAVVAAT